jgi:hypothetical protein
MRFGRVLIGVKNLQNGEIWGSLGQQGSITVNGGEKSGTISTSVRSGSTPGPAQVTGNWTCV